MATPLSKLNVFRFEQSVSACASLSLRTDYDGLIPAGTRLLVCGWRYGSGANEGWLYAEVPGIKQVPPSLNVDLRSFAKFDRELLETQLRKTTRIVGLAQKLTIEKLLSQLRNFGSVIEQPATASASASVNL